jgi:hypothetical protein
MIWLTWRQHRMQAAYMLLGLAVMTAALVPLGRSMNGAFDNDGLAACLRRGNPEYIYPLRDNNSNCGELADVFMGRFGSLLPLGILLVLLPLVVGLFFGAPLVAREVEHGTHRLVWTQGVSRSRWATTKFGLIGLAGLAAAAGYAALLTWWIRPLSKASGSRLEWLVFDLQGVVPLAYTVFAIALGIAAGAMSRKVLPAMGITLAGFIVTRVLVAWLGRPHYQTPVERKTSVVTDRLPNQLHGDWVISQGVYNASGQKIGTGGNFCAPASVPGQTPPPAGAPPAGAGRPDCDPSQYNLDVIQPGNRFWTFQWIEAGIFVALAAGLLVFAIYRVRRSLA